MIPTFDENGNLPSGVHKATLKEIEQKFAYTRHRRKLFAGFKRLVENLKSANCPTIYLDGSYITNKRKPADYDLVWDPTGVNRNLDPDILTDLETRKMKYLGDIFVNATELNGFPYFHYFQMDKHNNYKGIIKLNLRKSL